MIDVRHAKPTDPMALAPDLRQADLCEITAVTGETPLAALERNLAASDPCYAMTIEHDQPIGLFGVVPDQGDVGIVWLVGSDEIVKRAPTFIRQSKHWINVLHQRYRVLWNLVDARNQLHLRWLDFFGFSIQRTVEDYGVERRRFYEFYRERDLTLLAPLKDLTPREDPRAPSGKHPPPAHFLNRRARSCPS